MGNWTDYASEKPESAGLYEWLVPMARHPGLNVVVLAHMRERGAGFGRVVSPAFDRWDGYNVLVPVGTKWRATEPNEDVKPYSVRLVTIDGIENEPCPFCKRVPTFKGILRDSVGVILTAEPHTFNTWWLECCSWAKTPHVSDPVELSRLRNGMINPTPTPNSTTLLSAVSAKDEK